MSSGCCSDERSWSNSGTSCKRYSGDSTDKIAEPEDSLTAGQRPAPQSLRRVSCPGLPSASDHKVHGVGLSVPEDIDLDHLMKVNLVSGGFLHCKVTIFLFLIHMHFVGQIP